MAGNEQGSSRIVTVTIDGTEEGRVIKAPRGTQSVKVEFADGKTVTVNSDGGMSLSDGREVTIAPDGAVRVTGQRGPRASALGATIRGVQGYQEGNNNTQVNSFG